MRCFFLLASLFLTASVAAEAPKEVPLAEIPITTVNNRNVIYVRVAHYDLHLVLDTGATKTSLFQSEELAFADLERIGSSEIIFPALDEKVTGSRLEPLPIRLGDYEYQLESPLLVHKRPPVGDRLNFAFDGVLGQDFFHDFVVEIDPEARKLRLYKPGSKIGARTGTKIKLHIRGNAPYIDYFSQMPWERRPQRKSMLLDTGYQGLLAFWSDEHFVSAAGKNRAIELRAQNKGIFTRATFRLGRVKFMSAPVFIAPRTPMQAQERDGIVGNNVMNSHHHVIDFPGEALYLKGRTFMFKQIDGGFYVLNNESYIVKRFQENPTGSKMIIEGNDP